MNKTFKKVLSVILSLAMVMTTVTVYNQTAKAAELSEMIPSADYNLALGCDVSTGFTSWTGKNKYENLTNGNMDNPRVYPNGQKNGWYAIDLGEYYTVDSIDQVVTVYNETNTGTFPSTGYRIEYSMDGATYVTAKQVEPFTLEGAAPFTEVEDMTDVSVDLKAVRYVRFFYPDQTGYGIQVKQLSVLNLNGDAQTVELDSATDAAGVTAVSNGAGEISFTITAAEGQEDYTYSAYVDDSKQPSLTGLNAGQEYTITDVKPGMYTVKIVSNKEGLKPSEGIVSESVKVLPALKYQLTDADRNLAYKKTYTLYGGEKMEANGDENTVVTDGVLGNSSNYVATKNNTKGTGFTIDLAELLAADGIEQVGVWFAKNAGGTYPDNGDIRYEVRYSTDGVDFETVASVDATTFEAQRTAQNGQPFGVDVKISKDDLNVKAVKYVQVYFPNAMGWGAQVTEIGVFGTATPYLVVDVPEAEVTAKSTAYNTIEYTITATEGQEDFTYNVTIGDQKITGLSAGTYTADVPAGTYDVKVISVDPEGNRSKGVTVSGITVEDGFDYVGEKADGGVAYDATNGNGNNYVRYDGVTALASTEDGAAVAGQAIDNDKGSRWISKAEDPQWIVVDLKNAYKIKEVDLSWETANAKDFTVEVSTDGENYKTVATVKDAIAGTRTDSIVLKETVAARYVKINGTARTAQWAYSIYEMAIYGPDAEVEVAPDQNYDPVENWKEIGVAYDGSKYSVDEKTYDSISNAGAFIELNDDNSKTKYVPAAGCTVSGPVFVTAIQNYGTVVGNMKKIWVDGVSYKSGTDKCFLNGDQCRLSQDIFKLPENVKEKIFAVTVEGTVGSLTYAVKVTEGVSVDGKRADVTDGKITFGDAEYGYYCNGKMYAPNTTADVEDGMKFTSVNTLSVTMTDGAGIRYIGESGLRFQSTIASDNMEAVASDAITEGTLITTKVIFDNNNDTLELGYSHAMINVKNSGWFGDKVGTYCGSVCKITDNKREFIARSYVTVNYEDGTSKTVYSGMGPSRSVQFVAQAIIDAKYPGINEKYHSVIDDYAK